MPILQELNPRVTDWSMVPLLYDIWIYYRSQVKEIIMVFGIGYLPRYPLLPFESTSPIYGIPQIQRCTRGLSTGILKEAVQQVISEPCDPSSIGYEANPIVDTNQRINSNRGEFIGMLAMRKEA